MNPFGAMQNFSIDFNSNPGTISNGQSIRKKAKVYLILRL
ncbi:hypothetical protein CWATWH8502_112 [Crocosphaera watsonii WH 8502]|uniref:Uncharacterized protein n=1 Tax=Crocosphaera watsonii WH 8502 TaxID=423474 RepID=T2IEC9_CROWT|nr:hypothetical protein CWATWH8502_112 [Crocosphaera watsonii WH 8502]